ncbi:MAG: CehA/McbA family metallohydrolase, partial [Thermoleophilia bacterium]|nr:CehA/McbA family metallohydrolase [Thermoleophilia bacterium]
CSGRRRPPLPLLLVLLALAIVVALAAVAQPAFAADPLPITSYELYFGDLHAHTAYSDGANDTTPADAYAAAAAAGADYFATTDHEYMLEDWQWADTLAMADAATTESFVAIPGYEFFLQGGGACEINVFGTEERCDVPLRPGNAALDDEPYRLTSRRLEWSPLPGFYDWLVAHDAVGHFNHPHYLSKDFDDWNHCTEARDAAMGALEIHNYGSWLLWEYLDVDEEAFVAALDKGWHLMPAANSDTHAADWITGSPVRTVLLAEQLTRDDLVDAIKAQRGYATVDQDLRVQYTLDGWVMGSTLGAPPETATAWIRAEDPSDDPAEVITRLEIVADGGAVVAGRDFDTGNVAEWLVELDASAARYFYVRVYTASNVSGGPGITAWTAPVWTGR